MCYVHIVESMVQSIRFVCDVRLVWNNHNSVESAAYLVEEWRVDFSKRLLVSGCEHMLGKEVKW
jgi:hypothetical protein